MLQHLKQKIAEKANDIIEVVKLPDDERNARLDICHGCEKLGKKDFCKMCGCYMPAKTYLPGAKCPLGKW